MICGAMLVPEGTSLWINGRIVPIVGRVSADMLTVVLGPNADDKTAEAAISISLQDTLHIGLFT